MRAVSSMLPYRIFRMVGITAGRPRPSSLPSRNGGDVDDRCGEWTQVKVRKRSNRCNYLCLCSMATHPRARVSEMSAKQTFYRRTQAARYWRGLLPLSLVSRAVPNTAYSSLSKTFTSALDRVTSRPLIPWLVVALEVPRLFQMGNTTASIREPQFSGQPVRYLRVESPAGRILTFTVFRR